MVTDPTTELFLQPTAGQRTHEDVADASHPEVLAGRLRIGDRPPADRHLSETLGVSRTSVRAAVQVHDTIPIAEVVDVRCRREHIILTGEIPSSSA